MSGVEDRADGRQRWPESDLSVAVKDVLIECLIGSGVGTGYAGYVVLGVEMGSSVVEFGAQGLEFGDVEVGAAHKSQVDERYGQCGVEYGQTCVAVICVALFRLNGTFICQKHNKCKVKCL